jgi:hypothetical protein
MKTGLYNYDPITGKCIEIKTGLDVVGGVSFSTDGTNLAINGRNFDGLNEIWRGTITGNTSQDHFTK